MTDQGVTEFTVSYPVDIVNESKNVELLSMDTIKEIIKDDMTKTQISMIYTKSHLQQSKAWIYPFEGCI